MIFWFVALIGAALAALFAAIYYGVGALTDAQLAALVDSDVPEAAIAQRVLKARPRITASLLLLRITCLFGGAALAVHYGNEIGGTWVAVVSAALTGYIYVILTTAFTIVMRRQNHRLALRWVRWTRPLQWLTWPLAAPLAMTAGLVTRIMPDEIPEANHEAIADLTVEHVIDEGEQTGIIAHDHAKLLRSVLEFKNTVTREAMVPRTQVVAFEIDTPVAEVMASIIESGHSRYPVYRENMDHVEGILYAKDIFRAMQKDHRDLNTLSLAKMIRRPVFFAPETQKVGLLLREMQARRTHLAVVVDEFGGTSGVVTLEDILEEIVGEIQDEYDKESPSIVELSKGHYLADASASVYEIEAQLGEPLCEDEDKENFDTLGGMLVQLAGRVPQVGDEMLSGFYRIVVREGDERHVARVELVRDETLAADADTLTEKLPNEAAAS